ncbi:hypothetical protein [Okeania sp. KiyG1]|uniref:hypothetical protein n=1 Tax=Okeania sp. KiyG1 TaxID=2720165 RepID=UPI00198D2B72|nr:hypothetical protein [Okeania sp. KiyG1]GGA18061.1 hypothetical protein CYANOKiyG1_32360 [Okeania sp. KiyG1]
MRIVSVIRHEQQLLSALLQRNGIRGKIKEIIKENYAQIDKYSSYDFRQSLLEVAINEEDYENLARFKNWEQLLRDKVDKIIDENYDKISDIQDLMYEESFSQPLPYPYTDYPGSDG